MTKILFEESFIVCYLDANVPVLAHRWKAHPTSENFRSTLIRMIDLFKEIKKEYPHLTWCGDTTHLGVLSLDTQSWLTEKWSTIMVEAEVKYHALVVPKDVFAKFAMNKFKNNLDGNHKEEIIICQFADEKSANQWLQKCISAIVV